MSILVLYIGTILSKEIDSIEWVALWGFPNKRRTTGTYVNNRVAKKDTTSPTRKRVLEDRNRIRLLV